MHEWAQEFFKVKQRSVAASTFASYEEPYRVRIYPTMHACPLEKITPVTCSKWLYGLIDSGVPLPTVYKAYQVLRMMLNMAVDFGVIVASPLRAVKFPKDAMPLPRKSRDRTITQEQYALMLDAVASPRHRLVIRLALEVGLRSGEIAGLRYRDLIPGDISYIMVERGVSHDRMTKQKVVGLPKGRRTEQVAIPQSLMEDLLCHFEQQKQTVGADEHSYIFTGRQGRGGPQRHDIPQGRWTAGNVVAAACQKAGLVNEDGKPITTPHGLRASGASIAQQRGVHPAHIQRQLRHKDFRITQENYLAPIPPVQLAGYAAVFDAAEADD